MICHLCKKPIESDRTTLSYPELRIVHRECKNIYLVGVIDMKTRIITMMGGCLERDPTMQKAIIEIEVME